ncbi:MAG: VanZ family protein [Lawsonibacter sp.]|nr:VanZ family protein [Lawsonibacter sp.]
MAEVVHDVWVYIEQMIPLGLIALAVFLLLCPMRNRRLRRLGLTTSLRREVVLLLFVAFCAGLAALTLFPANLWAYVYDWLFRHKTWAVAWDGRSVQSFYPAWEEISARFAVLPEILTPFEEIRRAVRTSSYWLWFMLLGNIIMFTPIGFFPALLWRNGRWWKSLLIGFSASCTVEFIQFFIGRSTDIDDVILNTAGALAGFWVFWLLRAICPKLCKTFQCQPKGGYRNGRFSGN